MRGRAAPALGSEETAQAPVPGFLVPREHVLRRTWRRHRVPVRTQRWTGSPVQGGGSCPAPPSTQGEEVGGAGCPISTQNWTEAAIL